MTYHKCKKIPQYCAIIETPAWVLRINYQHNDENLLLTHGTMVDINYCPFCGGKLDV
jgi:hypothetical protein